MSRPPGCQARYTAGSAFRCERCNLTWDADETDPPECLSDDEAKHQRGRKALDELKQRLSDHEQTN